MKKEEYLVLRQQMLQGNINQETLGLMFTYWEKFRKDEYKKPDLTEFSNTFTTYLMQGVNYNNTINTIIPYFDKEFSITTVLDKNNNILTIF